MNDVAAPKKAPLDSILAGIIAVIISDAFMAASYLVVTAGIRRPAGDRPDFPIIHWAGLIQFLWILPMAIYEKTHGRRDFAKGAIIGGIVTAAVFFAWRARNGG